MGLLKGLNSLQLQKIFVVSLIRFLLDSLYFCNSVPLPPIFCLYYYTDFEPFLLISPISTPLLVLRGTLGFQLLSVFAVPFIRINLLIGSLLTLQAFRFQFFQSAKPVNTCLYVVELPKCCCYFFCISTQILLVLFGLCPFYYHLSSFRIKWKHILYYTHTDTYKSLRSSMNDLFLPVKFNAFFLSFLGWSIPH